MVEPPASLPVRFFVVFKEHGQSRFETTAPRRYHPNNLRRCSAGFEFPGRRTIVVLRQMAVAGSISPVRGVRQGLLECSGAKEGKQRDLVLRQHAIERACVPRDTA